METYFVGSWFKALAVTDLALSISSKNFAILSDFMNVMYELIK